MSDILYLAWRSLRYYWGRNLLLTAALASAVFVPLSLFVLAQKASRSLRERAGDTPMLLGARGSVTDLTLHSLYFAGQPLAAIKTSGIDQIDASLAETIPLHLRFHARHASVVGTTPAYFRYRRLSIVQGNSWQGLGDCVLGHSAARAMQLRPGDALMTESGSIVNLAGALPLMMRVSGVLAASGTADDDVVFVALETAWIIEGIGHGHEPQPGQSDEPHEAARPYTEVTDSNAMSFHFHGSRDDYPLSSVIVLPRDVRAQTLLVGQFASREDKTLQLVEPPSVLDDLLRSIFRLRWLVLVGALLVGLATAALVVLVLCLSFKLRFREFDTMRKIGAARGRIASLFACECLLVVALGLLTAGLLTWITSQFDQALVRWLL